MLEPWKVELNLSITIEVIAPSYNRATALAWDALKPFRGRLELDNRIIVVGDSLDARQFVVTRKY